MVTKYSLICITRADKAYLTLINWFWSGIHKTRRESLIFEENWVLGIRVEIGPTWLAETFPENQKLIRGNPLLHKSKNLSLIIYLFDLRLRVIRVLWAIQERDLCNKLGTEAPGTHSCQLVHLGGYSPQSVWRTARFQGFQLTLPLVFPPIHPLNFSFRLSAYITALCYMGSSSWTRLLSDVPSYTTAPRSSAFITSRAFRRVRLPRPYQARSFFVT
jgi:hypothetical protein